jgi:hypothetical protein
MSTVDHVDYAANPPRIYLDASTVGSNLDTIQVYRDVRALRRTTADHQKFKPIIVAGGNLEKIPGVAYTPRYVVLLDGCRLVPFNVSHSLKLIRDTFTDDGFAGRDCFDRTSLSASTAVNIDVDFPEIEIRQVVVGGSLLTEASIASAVRTNLTVELARIDAAISSIGGGAAPSASANALAVRAELALELARIDEAISATKDANVVQVNSATIYGTGTDEDPFREVP